MNAVLGRNRDHDHVTIILTIVDSLIAAKDP